MVESNIYIYILHIKYFKGVFLIPFSYIFRGKCCTFYSTASIWQLKLRVALRVNLSYEKETFAETLYKSNTTNLNLYGLQNAVSTCNSLRNDRCASGEEIQTRNLFIYFSIYSINEVIKQTCIFSFPNSHPTVLQIYLCPSRGPWPPCLKSMD